ncbi:hypothetical protein GOV09_06810 [Candidatus Woesearchaeota archaeon]|nr:hypothetical protein [Candidatus Woesearchaeota archaeon]
MEFDIPKRPTPQKTEQYMIAHRFAKAVHKELGRFLKGVVLFGSSARKTAKPHSDIDVLLLVDDVSILMTRDVADAYRMILQKIVANVSRKLHVVTVRITAFWDYMRNGDPIGINMLRDGISLYDTGFFEPLQLLLKKGKIRPSKESIWNYYMRSPATLSNARWHVMQATVDLYWAVIDAAHAALMSHDAIPPTPEHVADMLDDLLVRKGKLEKKYSRIMKNFYYRAKSVMHREVHSISGKEFDKYLYEAESFVERMKQFIKKV